MTKAIHELRNLGPRMETMLREVDIGDATALQEIGAIEAFWRLKFTFGRHVSVTALYAMEAALRDCDWRSLDTKTKARLRRSAKVT